MLLLVYNVPFKMVSFSRFTTEKNSRILNENTIYALQSVT